MRVVCISDTHLQRPWVPDGDLLIHAGGLTNCGSFSEVAAAAAWLNGLPHAHKVVIAGNHDWLFQREPGIARTLFGPEVTYLQDSAAEVCGLRFYGSPWQPYFQGWAFNLYRDQLAEKWERIPKGLDFLVTHGPPMGMHDQCSPDSVRLGCYHLTNAVTRTRPRFHVFGHIHPGRGQSERNGTTFVNASISRDDGRGLNDAAVFDL